MRSHEEKDLILTQLSKKEPNRFLLAVGVAKRAHQLKDGARPLVPTDPNELLLPVITAIEEIGCGKVTIKMRDNRDEDDFLAEEIHQLVQASRNEVEEDEKPKKEKTKSKSKSLGA